MRYKIVSRNPKKKKLTVWTDLITTPSAMTTACQYFLDSIDGLEDFMIMDCNHNGIFYDFLGVTASRGMRKRTFQERLNNVRIGGFEK